MMNRRTTNAPASTAGAIASQSETSNAWYMTYQSRKYGIRVLASCQSARRAEGRWYRATILLQAALSMRSGAPAALELLVVIMQGSRRPGSDVGALANIRHSCRLSGALRHFASW